MSDIIRVSSNEEHPRRSAPRRAWRFHAALHTAGSETTEGVEGGDLVRGEGIWEGGMYAGGGRAGTAEHGLAVQTVNDELTGLAAAASHAAATEAHTHSQYHHQLNHLAQQHQLAQQHRLSLGYQQAAMQLESRAEDLIHAHIAGKMPVPSSMMGGAPVTEGAPGSNTDGKGDLPPSKTRKRRQSQARLTQNAEAQKRYRYAHSHLARPCRSHDPFGCTHC